MVKAGVNGPVFVSIGDSEKLNIFLSQNPNVRREDFFVDNYSFDAYRAVGYTKKFAESNLGEVTKVEPPDLSPGQWMSYLGNAGKVQPFPNGQELQFPEGVLRLGGTMVVNGNDIVYQWNDLVPGDHPNIDYVMSVAKGVGRKNGAPLFT